MSRRAKKQRSERAPVSGTRFSNQRPKQSKKQRAGRREQERRKSKALLVVVPSEVASSAPSDSGAAAAPGSAEISSLRPLASLVSAADSAVEHLLPDEDLLEVERAFFERSSVSELPAPELVVTESEPASDDDVSLLLTPEE